jgi:hypothetical protein
VNRAEQEGRVDRVKDKKGKMLPKEVQKEALYELYGDEMGLDANLDRYSALLFEEFVRPTCMAWQLGGEKPSRAHHVRVHMLT